MRLKQWRIAAHLAWRTARRNKLRSSLVVTMIGLPVALVVAGSCMARTVIPNPQEKVSGLMGTADLVLASPSPEVDSAFLQARLPKGSQSVFLLESEVSLARSGEILEVSLISPDPGMQSPLLDGLLELEAGVEPSEAGEIALHPKVLELLDKAVGDEVTLAGETYSVSGVVREPQRFDRIIAVVGDGGLRHDVSVSEILIGLPEGSSKLPTEIVSKADAVISRSDVVEADRQRSALSDTLALAVGILALCAVGLVAAAAFIVGTHRQLRGLGILMAAGGEPRHARSVVLMTGVTLGLVGTVSGMVCGFIAARFAYPFLDGSFHRAVGSFEVSPYVIAGSIIMGVAAASLAAYAPARMAGKLTVLQALASRTPPPKPPANLVGIGVVLGVSGAIVTTWSMAQRQATVVAMGLLMMVLGVFLFIPGLVSLLGRIANLMALSGRQAARDASRHGRRTAAAIGAAIIALSLPIALASHWLSEERFERRTPALLDDQLLVGAVGRFRLSATEDLTGALDQAFPGATAAALSQAYEPGIEGDPQAEPISAFGLTHRSEPETIRGGVVYVGGRELLSAAGAEVPSGLASGDKAVVLQGYEPVDGMLTIPSSTRRSGEASLPAVSVPSPKLANESFPIVVIPPHMARDLGFEEVVSGYLISSPSAFSSADIAKARTIVGDHPGFYVLGASDYLPPFGLARAVSTGASVAVALGLLAVVVALVVAESRRSHQILVAIGSDPTMHRRIVAATSGLLALIASVLAVPAGLVPTWVVQNASGAGRPLAIPWITLAIVLVLTPLLAAIGAGLFAKPPRLGSLLRLSD